MVRWGRSVVLAVLAVGVLTAWGCQQLEARRELNAGNSLYKEEKYREALEHYQRGLELDPGLTFAWRAVAFSAMTLYRPGDESPENLVYADQAIEAFKKYLETHPGDQKIQDFLVATYVNANRHDDVLAYLQGEVAKNPADVKSHKAIVSLLLRTQKIREAYDWIVGHIPGAEAEPYYLVGVYCWDKSYRDPSLTPEQRREFVELGLTSVDKALGLQPEYFEAMVYTNLLYREKAKLEEDEELKQQLFEKADEWRAKALALREKLEKAKAAAAAAAAAAAPAAS